MDWGGVLPLGIHPAIGWIEPVGGGVNPTVHTERSFQLRAVKNPIAKDNVSMRVGRDHATMVRVGNINAPQ